MAPGVLRDNIQQVQGIASILIVQAHPCDSLHQHLIYVHADNTGTWNGSLIQLQRQFCQCPAYCKFRVLRVLDIVVPMVRQCPLLSHQSASLKMPHQTVRGQAQIVSAQAHAKESRMKRNLLPIMMRCCKHSIWQFVQTLWIPGLVPAADGWGPALRGRIPCPCR